MNAKFLPFEQSLQYYLAGACKENNLSAFKKLLLSPNYSHYDKTQLDNIAFLAAYMDANDDFIRYLIIDYKIQKTDLVVRFLNSEMLKLFDLRDLIIDLESLPINNIKHNFEKI